MSEEVVRVRLTRSQKRAAGRDAPEDDGKKIKLDRSGPRHGDREQATLPPAREEPGAGSERTEAGPLALNPREDEGLKARSESGAERSEDVAMDEAGMDDADEVLSKPPPEDKVLSKPPPEDKVLPKPPPEDKALPKPPPEDKALSKPPPEDKALSKPPPEDKALSKPPPEDKALSKPSPKDKVVSKIKPEDKALSKPELKDKVVSKHKVDSGDKAESEPVEEDKGKVRPDPREGSRGKPESPIDNQQRIKPDSVAKVASILNTGEVKATIKVEVQTGEQPVDMSTSKSEVKENFAPSPDEDGEEDEEGDDVIVLSDSEPSSPQLNGLMHFKELDTDRLMKSSPEERERIMKQLKEELRLEEARLVLLKKLRQSQVQKDGAAQKPIGSSNAVATPPPLIRGTITANKGSQQVLSGRSSATVIPPPLVRGGQQSSKLGSQTSQIIMPPLVRGAQQVHTLRQQPHSATGSGSGPPPLLLAPRASVPSVQGQRVIQSGLIRVTNVNNTSLLVNMSQASPTALKGSTVTSQSGMTSSTAAASINESPASRQAAAKLALRKQLEKTLLDIPPPKPPAPELNFLPSAANNEFIYLVGLEEVVQNLLDTISKSKTPGVAAASSSKEPFACTQCKTDFTSRWRQDKVGAIMCDHCMTSSQKKSLKAEHTNRLKAAFVKALQQEQEIEQRILQQAASPVSHTHSSSSPAMKTNQQILVSQQIKQAQARANALQHRGQQMGRHHSTTIKQTSGQLSRPVQTVGARGVPHTFSSSSQLQNAVAAAALVSRPGKHAMRAGAKVNSGGGGDSASASAPTWRKQSSATTGVTMAYVNPSLTVHKSTSAVERQREYLLDMIPSRTLSQAANTWK